MTLPLKFNADYETFLFTGKEAPPVINQSLEYLILFLEDAPLFTTKKYSDEYLRHVEDVSGKKPLLTSKGPFENWWGLLRDIPNERKVNSKEMSAAFIPEAKIISEAHEFTAEPSMQYLAKPLSEMSGRGFCLINQNNLLELEEMLKRTSPVIVEPYLDRKFDFSHYILPDRDLCYENIVDSRFQYKGTTFRNLKEPSIESLSFYSRISQGEWVKFKSNFQKIKNAYEAQNVNSMYSVDSFIYVEQNDLKIRDIAEVNVRKTMGYIAWKLSEKYAQKSSWSQLLLAKNKGKMSFEELIEKTQSLDCLYLSPSDVRFDIFFLKADSEEMGREKLVELKRLLPDTEFPV